VTVRFGLDDFPFVSSPSLDAAKSHARALALVTNDSERRFPERRLPELRFARYRNEFNTEEDEEGFEIGIAWADCSG
jgi:hypothetical protein